MSYDDSDEESSSSEGPEGEFKYDLHRFIENIKAAGSFSTFGVANEFMLPGLHVAGVGDISLPISESDARRMIAESKQAPFGKGNETVVDLSVRKTWELESVEFRNPKWQGFLDTLLLNVKDNLGVAADIQAEFYKLLIYEEGAMFKSHRDTEKVPGMFGTLVVCLPSSHQGGHVELRHGKNIEHYHTDKMSAFDISYLAWYCDVAHEIHPVSAGYRVVLTYNLTAKSDLVSANGLDEARAEFKKVLEPWRQFNNSFLMSTLSHPYSGLSLCNSFLKGHDARRVKFLDLYCKEDDQIVPLLAKMKLHAEILGDDSEDPEVREKLTVYDIRFTDGVSLTFEPSKSLIVPFSCVLEGNIWRHREPNKQYGGEYCGNSNASIEKEYHDAVVILVKASHLNSFLLGGNPSSIRTELYVDKLNKLLSIQSKSGLAKSLLAGIYSICATESDSYKGVAAVCAIYQQRADLFSQVASRLTSCFEEHSYRALGRLIDVDNAVVDLEDLSSIFTRSASVHDVWTNSRAFISGANAARSSITLLSFTRSVVLHVLKIASTVEKEDSTALKGILLELEGEKKAWKSFTLEAVKCFLERHADNASFATEFFLQSHNVDSPVTRSVVISTLPVICKGFDLKSIILPDIGYSSSINSHTMQTFLSMVRDHLNESIPLVLEKILSQAANLEAGHFWGLIRLLLKHDIAPSDFCQSLTTLYLTDAIGQEPSKPTDWARSAEEGKDVHCFTPTEDCKNCQAVKRFLLDPSLEKQTFSNEVVNSGSYGYQGCLEIAKQDDSGWLITKTDKYWKKKHSKWSEQLKEFRTAMTGVGEGILVRKLGGEKDKILNGECILHKPDDVSESGSPPAKRLKVSA